VRQVSEAAHALHEAGVIHRDIKPGNVMVSADGTQAVLMDLGIAQLADEAEGRLTRTRQFVGTLRYASPEQVLALGRLDRRSDVYSLGATLWELLTLRPLYGAGEEASPFAVEQAIVSKEAERVRKHHPGVPGDLEAVVLKCLEKDRDRRYPTARELAEDLGRWLRDEPVTAQPPTLPYVMGKYVRRHRLAIGAAIVVLLGLTLGGAWIIHKDRAHLQTQAALEQALAGEALERAEREAVRRENAELALAREKAASEADRERIRAQEQERNARRSDYQSSLQAAYRYWDEGSVATARDNLKRLVPRPDQEELRGFEWYYLWRLSFHRGRLTLEEGSGAVTGVVFFPDGKTLAVASGGNNSRRRGAVKLWDLATKRVRATLQGPAGPVTALALSPDGRCLATGSEDQTVKVWNVATGKEQTTLQGHDGRITSVAFSLDGKTLATAAPDSTVRLWDMPSGKETRRHKVGLEFAIAVAFSPDGKMLAAGTAGGPVKLWDRTTGQERTILAVNDGVHSLAFTPDSKTLAAGYMHGQVAVIDLATGRPRFALHAHRDTQVLVAVAPDGLRLATASSDSSIKLWNLATGQEEGRLIGHLRAVRALAFSPDGGTLASGSSGGTVMVWDTSARPEAAVIDGMSEVVRTLGFTPDGKTLLTGGGGPGSDLDQPVYGEVRMWDVASRGELATLQTAISDTITSLAYSADGQTLVAGVSRGAATGRPGLVKVWDVATRKVRAVLKGHSGPVWSVAISPDGRTLATGEGDPLTFTSQPGELKLWDLATGQLRTTLTVEEGAVNSVAFSPDGKLVAAGMTGKVARVWEVATGRLQATLRGRRGTTLFVAFSPDGKTLAAASANQFNPFADPGELTLWDVATGQEQATLQGHDAGIIGVAFSPDGKTLATASADRTIGLWDVAEKKRRATLKGAAGLVACLAFSPDGKTLVGGGGSFPDYGQGELKLWDLATQKERVFPQGRTAMITCAAFSPDGKTLAAGGYLGLLALWDAATGKKLTTLHGEDLDTFQGHTHPVSSLAVSPDGKTLATGSGDRTIKLWDLAAQRVRATLAGHAGPVTCVAFSPDGRTLATGSGGSEARLRPGDVKLWDAASGELRTTLPGHPSGVSCLAFAPDGKTLASGHPSVLDRRELGRARLWDTATGKLVASVEAADLASVSSLAFSADGQTLAIGDRLGPVKLWDMTSRQERVTCKGHTHIVSAVAFSPDGKTLATASHDRTVKLWQAANGKELLTLKGHADPVLALAFSPDGQTLASGGSRGLEGEVKLWRAAGKLITQESYVDRQIHGYARIVATFDDRGREVERAYFDEAGRPARHPDGNHTWIRAYNDQDKVIEETFAGHDGSQGFVKLLRKYNDAGQMTEMAYLDEAGKPARHRDLGYARATFTGDGKNTVDAAYFDRDDSPLRVRVVIKTVNPDSQGERLGLKPGDIVLSYDGKEILNTFRFISGRRDEREGEGPRELVILREGQRLTFSIKPGLIGVVLEDRALPEAREAQPEPVKKP
jgi:WD40 repeat protein